MHGTKTIYGLFFGTGGVGAAFFTATGRSANLVLDPVSEDRNRENGVSMWK